MFGKVIKFGLVATTGAVLAGGLLFGRELYSYVCTSARSVQTAVRDSVPIEFELERARTLVEQIVPEMHASVRTIAEQEVEIEHLKKDIDRGREALAQERAKVARLRDALGGAGAGFTFGGLNYTRDQVKNDLARRFDMLKEAEVVLAGKERLLDNRQKSLAAAVQVLERTRTEKEMLAGKIASLEAQHKLIQAASAGSELAIDNSKLAQTERLITQIKKQLDVAERVLAHESRFIEPIAVDTVSEAELLVEVDEHLGARQDPAVATR